jgi:hypothetical protein
MAGVWWFFLIQFCYGYKYGFEKLVMFSVFLPGRQATLKHFNLVQVNVLQFIKTIFKKICKKFQIFRYIKNLTAHAWSIKYR